MQSNWLNALIVRFILIYQVRPVSPNDNHAQLGKVPWNLAVWKQEVTAEITNHGQITNANACVLIVENQDTSLNIVGQKKSSLRILKN